jgi:hypothetical protein
MSETVVRRVVLALDSGERTVTVVREAVRVASHFGAELEGLFVEDVELVQLTGHAFARRVAGEGPSRALSVADLEQEWRAFARAAREALEEEAERRRVRARFAVQRARAREAIRERLARGDVVVVGWGGWAPRAERTAPVRVLFAGDAAPCARALEVGRRLAGPSGRLEVWIAPDDEALAAQEDAIRERVGDAVGELRILALADQRPATLRRAVAERPGGLFIVPAGSALAERLGDRSVAARFPASVVLIQ